MKTFSVLSLIVGLHIGAKGLLCNLNKCSYIACQCTFSYGSSSGDRVFQITDDGFIEDVFCIFRHQLLEEQHFLGKDPHQRHADNNVSYWDNIQAGFWGNAEDMIWVGPLLLLIHTPDMFAVANPPLIQKEALDLIPATWEPSAESLFSSSQVPDIRESEAEKGSPST